MSNADTQGSNTTTSAPHVPSVVRRSNGTRLKEYDEHLDMENFDLIAKVVELLTTHKLWGPDGTYSFEDGERWAKLEDNFNE